MTDVFIRMKRKAVATLREHTFFIVHAFPLTIPKDLPAPWLGPVLVDAFLTTDIDIDGEPLDDDDIADLHELPESLNTPAASGDAQVIKHAELDEPTKDSALLDQTVDTDGEAADILPKVTFSNMDRDYLADQKRKGAEPHGVECVIHVVPSIGLTSSKSLDRLSEQR